MADFTFSITDNRIKELLAAKAEAVPRILEAVGLHLEGEAKGELENAPRRIDTGNLRNSITHEVEKQVVYVGTNVKYAPYVHEGTRRMEANRFLKNAFERNIDQVSDYIRKGLENA